MSICKPRGTFFFQFYSCLFLSLPQAFFTIGLLFSHSLSPCSLLFLNSTHSFCFGVWKCWPLEASGVCHNSNGVCLLIGCLKILLAAANKHYFLQAAWRNFLAYQRRWCWKCSSFKPVDIFVEMILMLIELD